MHLFGGVLAVVLISLTCRVAASCDDYEHYDPPRPDTACYYGCAATLETQGMWANLFQPPSIPYKYEGVCTMVFLNTNANGTKDVEATAELYSSAHDSGTFFVAQRLLAWNRTTVVAGDWRNGGMETSPFQTFGVSFVAWQPQVFIGVRIAACNEHLALGCAKSSGTTLVYSNLGSSPLRCFYPGCGNGDKMLAVSVRASGRPYSPSGAEVVSAGWTCNVSWYGDGGACDCGCGLEDPDCLRGSRLSPQCNATAEQVCVEGECLAPGWTPGEPGCDTGMIAGDGHCSCGCGGTFVDPDCFNPFNSVVPGGCSTMKAPVCKTVSQTANYCVEQWTCPSETFKDGTACDCGCGPVPDPDCENQSLPMRCSRNSTGLLFNRTQRSCLVDRCVAPGWTCDPKLFGDGLTCDCECGAYDIDCDSWSTGLRGCTPDTGNECGYDGRCLFANCTNGHLDRSLGESCDGGAHCRNDTCQCELGYWPTNPKSFSCVSKCGDGYTTDGEDCDGGLSNKAPFCADCRCMEGHAPLAGFAQSGVCSGCGNGVLDPGSSESCDGGLGCYDNCTCGLSYIPVPLSVNCRLRTSKDSSTISSSSSRGPIVLSTELSGTGLSTGTVAAVVGGIVGGCVLVAVVFIVIIFVLNKALGPKRKREPTGSRAPTVVPEFPTMPESQRLAGLSSQLNPQDSAIRALAIGPAVNTEFASDRMLWSGASTCPATSSSTAVTSPMIMPAMSSGLTSPPTAALNTPATSSSIALVVSPLIETPSTLSAPGSSSAQ